MSKNNLSICLAGINLADTPSTSVSVTKWISTYEEYVALCNEVWQMLGCKTSDSLAIELLPVDTAPGVLR